jgi:tetratricopeptide (TPR) repeat protein
MPSRDWFRRTTWTSRDEHDFSARLARSRSSFHKAQYTKIQAITLAQIGDKALSEAALRLLQRLFAEFPDPSQLEGAHLQAALIHVQLGNEAAAIEHFRSGLRAKAAYPNSDAGTALEFPWFIARHNLSAHFVEALEALKSARLAFPVQVFKSAAIRATVAQFQGDQLGASRFAREALEAASLKRSPFRYHSSLGLVGGEYEPTIQELRKLAAA